MPVCCRYQWPNVHCAASASVLQCGKKRKLSMPANDFLCHMAHRVATATTTRSHNRNYYKRSYLRFLRRALAFQRAKGFSFQRSLFLACCCGCAAWCAFLRLRLHLASKGEITGM